MKIFPQVLLSLFALHFILSQDCDENTGPAGLTGCVLIPRYGDYQYGVCLTQEYIQRRTQGKWHCEGYTTYCWFQCMAEFHNQDYAPVSPDCLCDPSVKIPVNNITLPEWCYSPSGKVCSWYLDCLETRYPCKNTEANYAVAYANHFCNLYANNYESFTPLGQQWVDAVRKCLQVSLVPLLRSWSNADCEEIKSTAFASHTPCYLQPEPGAPSICDLQFKDWSKVFKTIKGAIVSAFSESLKGFLKVFWGCIKPSEPDLTWKSILLEMTLNPGFKKNSELNLDSIGEKIIASIALQMNWDHSQINWFAFIEDNSTSSNFSINLQIYSNENSTVNVTSVVDSFFASVRSGKIVVQIEDQDVRVHLAYLHYCSNMNCTVIAYSTKAVDPTNNSSFLSFNFWIFCFCWVTLILLH